MALALTDNPWKPSEWNITRQGEYLRRFGKLRARYQAAAAGSFLGATKPTADAPTTKHLTRIVNKSITNITGNRGYSGDGPPGEDV